MAYYPPPSSGAVEGTAVLSTGETGGTKFLREDGDGTCSWQAAAGTGNVSKVGTPADNQVGVWTGDGTIEGDTALTFNTTTDKLSAGGTTGSLDTGTIELGHASDTTIARVSAGVVSVEGKNVALNGTAETLTTGSIELGAASDTTITRVSAGLIAVEGKTLLSNTATAGVGATPTASQTDTVTHGLGRVPTIIRVFAGGTFTNNTSAVPTTFSHGIYCSSGNFCIYQRYDPTTITTAEPMATSNTYALRADTGVGNFVTGVIQNVGATTFDIAWTETGTATAQVYMWEAQ